MMPAYNAEEFISDAIQSVLDQDYENLQMVICDDASTDGTARIITDYATRYPGKILAICNEKNLGVTRNCNLALRHCDGTYVALFAGDDLMLPGKISAQVEMMTADKNIVLCYHPVEIFDSASGKTIFVTNQTNREDVYSYSDILLKGGIPGGCSIMVRKDAIPDGGYDERLRTVSDWLFFFEISLKGKITKINQVLGRYRKHGGGASQKTLQLLDESLQALDIASKKYSDVDGLQGLVDRGKARYIAGEAFRQLNGNPKFAYDLIKKSMEFDPKNRKYKILKIICWINLRVPAGHVIVGNFFVKAKYFIKRIGG